MPTDGSGSQSSGNDQNINRSPTKASKSQRTAQLGRTPTRTGQPNTAKLPSSLNKQNSSTQRVPSGRYIPNSKSTARGFAESVATAAEPNFVYRARPSIQLSARLPQTPQIRSSTFGKSGATTARRMPRRNESIQAYSMNGSPLGVLDLAVEVGVAATATSESDGHSDAGLDEGSHGGDEEDWEHLAGRESYLPPIQTLQQTPSALKSARKQLLKKGSSNSLFSGNSGTTTSAFASASSAFKAAIVAGAHRATASKSSSVKAPSREAFTFALNGDQQDHEAWLAKLRGDMESMQMSAADKHALQRKVVDLLNNNA